MIQQMFIFQIEIEPPHSAYPNVTCLPGDTLHLYKGQQCELPPGEHVYTSVVLEAGSTIVLEGDPSGSMTTLLHVDTIEVNFTFQDKNWLLLL
jgi:hypothetical protein